MKTMSLVKARVASFIGTKESDGEEVEIRLSKYNQEWVILNELNLGCVVEIDEVTKHINVIADLECAYKFFWDGDCIVEVKMVSEKANKYSTEVYYSKDGKKIKEKKFSLIEEMEFTDTETVYEYSDEGELIREETTYEHHKGIVFKELEDL